MCVAKTALTASAVVTGSVAVGIYRVSSNGYSVLPLTAHGNTAYFAQKRIRPNAIHVRRVVTVGIAVVVDIGEIRRRNSITEYPKSLSFLLLDEAVVCLSEIFNSLAQSINLKCQRGKFIFIRVDFFGDVLKFV